MTYKPRKLGQTDVVFRHQSSSVGLCTQKYKSPCVVVMICATMVNTHTHRQPLTGCTISSVTLLSHILSSAPSQLTWPRNTRNAAVNQLIYESNRGKTGRIRFPKAESCVMK